MPRLSRWAGVRFFTAIDYPRSAGSAEGVQPGRANDPILGGFLVLIARSMKKSREIPFPPGVIRPDLAVSHFYGQFLSDHPLVSVIAGIEIKLRAFLLDKIWLKDKIIVTLRG